MMWPPSNVVDRHKKRAICIWLLLLALIASYTIWLFLSTYEKRKNPAVALQIQAERYPFPTVSLCVLANSVGFGCDSWAIPCISTMYTYFFAARGFEVNNGTSNHTTTNKAYPNLCIDIWLSDVPQEELTGLYPPMISFVAHWAPNTTGVGAEYQVDEISESIYVFFTDPEIPNPLGDHNQSTYIGDIPYRRQLADATETNFVKTSISMEMTESVNLDDETTKSYFAAAITPNDYIIPGGFTILSGLAFDVATTILSIDQPDLSHTIRREVDPLEWEEIVGNIGGTWEILLIMWGLLFVATRIEPNLKSRNLKKTAQRGVEGVVRGAQSVASTISGHRVSTSATFEGEEAAAAWDPAAREDNARVQRARIPAPAFNPGTNDSAPADLAAAINAHQPQSNFFRSRRFGRVIPNQNRREAGSDASNEASRAGNIVAVDIPRPVSHPPL